MMTHLVETLAGVIVAGWVLQSVLSWFLPRRVAVGLAFAGTVGWAVVPNAGWGIWMALMVPFGAMLPVLCLASIGRAMGRWTLRHVHRLDALLVLIGMLIVLGGAAGLLPFSPYAWFYAGLGPFILAVALSLWATWRGYAAILFGVVLGQVFWLADIGSSNFYAHISHFFLLFPVIFALISRPKS